MTIRRLVQAVLLAGMILAMAVSASADNIVYNTSDPSIGFAYDPNPNALILNSVGGSGSATLTFTGDTPISTGTPSGISYGHFVLACTGCTTQAIGTGYALFSPFTFYLVVSDTTDGASGLFIGSGAVGNGMVYSDVSPIVINWEPLVLGPGTNNAMDGGNFGWTVFTTTNPTQIVAPNNGDIPGRTTVQGAIDSIPEPATFSLIGGALLGLGFWGRKRLSRG